MRGNSTCRPRCAHDLFPDGGQLVVGQHIDRESATRVRFEPVTLIDMRADNPDITDPTDVARLAFGAEDGVILGARQPCSSTLPVRPCGQ